MCKHHEDIRYALFKCSTLVDEKGDRHSIKVPLTEDRTDAPDVLTLREAADLGIDIPRDIPRIPAISQFCSVETKEGQEVIIERPLYEDTEVLPDRMSYADAQRFGLGVPVLTGITPMALLSAMPGHSNGNIYSPVPVDKTAYANEPEPMAAKPVNCISGQEIYRYLKSHFCIRLFEEGFYLFYPSEGIYKEISEANLDRLINQHFGKKIEEADDLKCYSVARGYLRKDYELFVPEDAFLALGLWPFRNGIYDIRSGMTIANTGQFFIRSVLQCDYNVSSLCPRFDQFVSSVAGSDNNLIELIWETVGYLLSRDCSGKVFFVCVGPKDSGKSLFAKVIARIVGRDAVSYLSAADFAGRFDVAELRAKQLNLCMDLPNKALSPNAVGKIKALTGNDTIRSDVKFKKAIDFKPTVRLLFGTNSSIRTEVFDPAFDARMVVLPFSYPVPKSEQNFGLEDELVAEADGICRKAISFYLKLVESGYRFTKVDWSDDDRSVIDYDSVIQDFVNSFLEITGSENDRLASSDLYKTFEDFCLSKALHPLELNDFSKRVRKVLGNQVIKKKLRIDGKPVQGFTGIRYQEQD